MRVFYIGLLFAALVGCKSKSGYITIYCEGQTLQIHSDSITIDHDAAGNFYYIAKDLKRAIILIPTEKPVKSQLISLNSFGQVKASIFLKDEHYYNEEHTDCGTIEVRKSSDNSFSLNGEIQLFTKEKTKLCKIAFDVKGLKYNE